MEKINRYISCIVILTGILLASIVVPLHAAIETRTSTIDFYIKARGMMNQSKAGDLALLSEQNRLYFQGSELYQASFDESSNFLGFSGELGIQLHRYSIGLEIGYLFRQFDTTVTMHGTAMAIENDYRLNRDSRLSVMPFFFNLQYRMVNTNFLKLNTLFGFGIFYATYKEQITETVNGMPYSQVDGELLAKTNFPGIRFGLGLELQLAKWFSIVADGYYQIATFRRFKGDIRYRDSHHLFDEYYEGQLYFYTHESSGEGRFAIEGTLPEEWTGEEMKSNLTGINLSIGVKLTF